MKARIHNLPNLTRLVASAVLSTLSPQLSTVFAQGTAFTYQGRLSDNGGPASGVYDLRFTIYPVDSGGSPVAEPFTNSAVHVFSGLFTVRLDFGDGVFTGPARWLEIGVRTNGSPIDYFPLAPRQSVTASPYAITAGKVTGPIEGGSIVNGTVSGSQLSPGAAAANLGASGQSGVARGGVVLSTSPSATELLKAGYVKLTAIETAERYRSLRNTPPGRRSQHTAVWTGTEMIIFGGINNSEIYDDGARYDPALDRWTPLPKLNAPSARFAHTAVWDAHRGAMVVWGGANANTTLADGGVYDLARDTWTPIPASPVIAARDYHSAVILGNTMIVWGGTSLPTGGAALNTGGRLDLSSLKCTTTSVGIGVPAARYVHRAIATDTEMIVWGGAASGSAFFNDGARYDPATDLWTALPTPPLQPRYAHTMVWTGSRMLAWGGVGAAAYNDGAEYDPVTTAWSRLPATGAPAARYHGSAIWTGSEMIVFGGKDAGNVQLGDGGRFDPDMNTWTPLPAPDFYARRWLHTAIWTGNEMIVWGGEYGGGQDTGRRFNPVTGEWTPMHAARRDEVAVWTGSELIFWGGVMHLGNNVTDYRDDGLRWNAATDSWRRIPPDPAMPARAYHTAVWTGTEMIVWGGTAHGGGRYNPAGEGSWTAIPSEPTMDYRQLGTALWTGSEMIVWGGIGPGFADFNADGGRYNPVSGVWTHFAGDPAVPGRIYHSAIWTGSEMIVWGGYNQDPGHNFASGGRYDPAADQWTVINPVNAPSARFDHSAIWTGNEMMVWGGWGANYANLLSDGARYDRASDSWTPMQAPAAIGGRHGHTAVWTGSQMLIWGGGAWTGAGYRNSVSGGARYEPGGAGQWFPIAPNHTIGGRANATGIWTGSEMIVACNPYALDQPRNFAEVFAYTPPKTLYLYLRP